MDNEPEVIQRQMEQTRSALAEKLGELERQVMDTVQSTTATVSETVENVTETVSETVENVSEAVSEAVHTVKSTFDIKGHVQRHPWPMMGGSVVLGFLGGRLLNRATAYARRRRTRSEPALERFVAPPEPVERHNGAATAAPTREKSWLGSLGEALASEMGTLKQLALGVSLGAIRDVLAQSAPPNVAQEIGRVFDNLTTKLGGKPIRGPIVGHEGPEHQETRDGGTSDEERNRSEMGRPLGTAHRENQAVVGRHYG